MINEQLLEKSTVKTEADILRNGILNAPDRVSTTGTKWYISKNGDDNNSGSSPEHAWGTPEALITNADLIKFGDAVLFERGGVYRGGFMAESGIFYGAFGTGEKPNIYISRCNYAKTEWKSAGNGLWLLKDEHLYNVGLIVFNGGEEVGVKKLAMKDVCEPFDFCDAGEGRLYLCLEQKPSDFQSIEIGTQNHIIMIPSSTRDVTIENLALKFGGAHGIFASPNAENITVRGCEIAWIGGSLLTGYGDGTVRYGNGIEFWKGAKNILVENNWIYQIYDSGISNQGNGEYTVENLTFRNNLIEFCCFGSIEYWLDNEAESKVKNVTYEGNIMRFAGYGWGVQRPDKETPVHLSGSGGRSDLAENFMVVGNVFEQCSNMLVRVESKGNLYPVLTGNTYIQCNGGSLGRMSYGECLPFDTEVETRISEGLKDTFAKWRFI